MIMEQPVTHAHASTSAQQTAPEAISAGKDSSVRDVVTNVWAALQFLTRLPTPALVWRDDTLANSLLFFPLVGLALGAAAGGLDQLLAAHWPPLLASVTTLAGLIAVTGGLHEDGLADCADAFGAQRSATHSLAILHDSRIGVYGALALALSVLMRVVAIAALPPGRCVVVLAAAVMLSRCAILPLTLLPPATPKAGQGSHIAACTPHWIILAGALVSALLTLLLLGARALPALLAAATITALTAHFYRRRLGGVTGDCFGATVQMVEIAVLLIGAWTA